MTGWQAVSADAKSKVDTLSVHFSGVYRTDNGAPATSYTANPPVVIDDLRLMEDMVRSHLESLDINKSAGPDGIHPAIVKPLAGILGRPPCPLFKLSLEQGILPLNWKTVPVVAKHKEGPSASWSLCALPSVSWKKGDETSADIVHVVYYNGGVGRERDAIFDLIRKHCRNCLAIRTASTAAQNQRQVCLIGERHLSAVNRADRQGRWSGGDVVVYDEAFDDQRGIGSIVNERHRLHHLPGYPPTEPGRSNPLEENFDHLNP
ncbi:unnamed protein product [Echinostoma caproni]|uniref:Uncharacterized protein n=1 Tax=Echinostoma caproni TaxID=27848 RepID=A0A183ANQ7_9TREM|nr:unnamed protein product [Echinostoma caproni]